MADAQESLYHHSRAPGWTVYTQLALCLQFIDDQNLADNFETFLVEKAQFDNANSDVNLTIGSDD